MTRKPVASYLQMRTWMLPFIFSQIYYSLIPTLEAIIWCFFWPCIIVKSCFNYQLNTQFLYSITIYMLHYNPRHVSSNTMLIFRLYSTPVESRLQSIPLSTGVLYSCLQTVTIKDAVIIQMTSWRWARYCSKHVEDYNVTYIVIE